MEQSVLIRLGLRSFSSISYQSLPARSAVLWNLSDTRLKLLVAVAKTTTGLLTGARPARETKSYF